MMVMMGGACARACARVYVSGWAGGNGKLVVYVGN